MEKVNILFVDDHKMIMEGYKMSLHDYDKHALSIYTKATIDEAVNFISNVVTNKIDIAFLDVSMPSSEMHNIHDGEQLAEKIKQISPDTKIVFVTMHNDTFRMKQLIKNINPDGILIKSDIDPELLKSAMFEVIENPPYYSKEVRSQLRDLLNNDFSFDKYDIEILHYLSKGFITKELPEYIPLNKRTIEKKKKAMKELLEIENHSDIGLVMEAKLRGFI